MNESCEQFQALLPQYWSGAISVNQHKRVDQHLGGCAECRAESEYLGRVWTNLELIPAASPGPALRARFYESLDAYKRGTEEVVIKKREWWWNRPLFQLAAAAAMLAVGAQRRSLLAAAVGEQLLVLGSAVLLGVLSGLGAALLVLPAVPELPDPGPPPLLYTPHLLGLAVFLVEPDAKR